MLKKDSIKEQVVADIPRTENVALEMSLVNNETVKKWLYKNFSNKK